MNKYAVYHQPESRFAYAADPHTLVITLRMAASDKPERVEILYNNKYDFTHERFSVPMRAAACDGVFSYYRVRIALSDVRFAYVFKITEKGKTYYYSEEGLTSAYDFDLAYYTFFQFPFINAVDVMPVLSWAENATFYQIFVDRFARGDFAKDEGNINTPWGSAIDRHSFCGGDLDGITQKLGYLRDLGINALYLTPVFLSSSNHKYNIKDYLHVDPQFGDADALKRLLAAAHARGMKVVIDCVFNHCDAAHELFADVCKRGRDSQYYDRFLIDGDAPDVSKGNYACFASCKYMPKWNTSNAAVRRYLTDVALEYVRMGFDGLRLDVADEISHEMWRQLRRECKAENPDTLIIGEIWHDNEHWLRGEQFDGVMNYKLQKILADGFGKSIAGAKEVAARMNKLLVANTEQANAMALNFLDNHDTPRFLRLAGGNKDKLLAALVATVVFPGMPCMFYGTELPLDGDGDPDCRKPFDWTKVGQDKEYWQNIKTILGLKKQAALSGGNAQIEARGNILTITRRVGGECITAYFCLGRKSQKLAADGQMLFSHNCDKDTIFGNGVLVVKNNNSIPGGKRV